MMKFVFPIPNMSRVKAVVQPWELTMKGPDQTRLARRAEDLGYDYLRVPEHLVIPRDHTDLSGKHYFHSTAAQGYLLGATERIRVTTSVTILPLQHPISLAKALSSIDWLSSGRTNVSFGLGWLEDEYAALGVSFKDRGQIMDEYLAALIELWTKEWPCFEGRFVSFKDIAFEPKPVQKPYIPIWLGGDSDPALKRIARFASGWNPFLTKPDDFPSKIDFIKSQPCYRGGPLEVLYSLSSGLIGEGHVPRTAPRGKAVFSVDEMADTFGWLRDCGVTIASFSIPPVKDVDAYIDYAQWFIEEIKPKVQ
jgi:probable F420-dependent oxidoreductase